MEIPVRELVEVVAEENDADVFLYAGPLIPEGDETFISMCSGEEDRPNIVLYLTTLGGSADSAYRIARHLHSKYSQGKVILIVNSMCKSAGTLSAVGAHTIAMSDRGELGPLDVQIGERDEVFSYQSGLVAIQALVILQQRSFEYFEDAFLNLTTRSRGRITTRTAAEIASSLTGSLFGNIYSQLDPMRLGENYRHMLVAESYANRLAEATGVNGSALHKLLTEYPSHEFVIDRTEARGLFPDVRELSESERHLADCMAPVAETGLNSATPTIVNLTETLDEPPPSNALLSEHKKGRNQNDKEEEPAGDTTRCHEEGTEKELETCEAPDQGATAEEHSPEPKA